MEMLTDLFRFCHDLDQLIGEILRMGSHETDPLQAFDFLHLFQKLCKAHGLLEIFAVGVDVLAQKHDFHHAVCHQGYGSP